MVQKYLKFRIPEYLGDESGAVTVDWVVLTSATVLLAALVFPFIWAETESGGATIGERIVSNVEQVLSYK
jgi:hypothetical protein